MKLNWKAHDECSGFFMAYLDAHEVLRFEICMDDEAKIIESGKPLFCATFYSLEDNKEKWMDICEGKSLARAKALCQRMYDRMIGKAVSENRRGFWKFIKEYHVPRGQYEALYEKYTELQRKTGGEK